MFPYRNIKEFGILLIFGFFLVVLIPAVTIFTMYGIGLISSLKLEDKTERIGPLMVTVVAYLWAFLNFRTNGAIPSTFSAFILGATISLGIGFFINNFHKISLHAIGMGGLFIAVSNVIVSNGRSFSHFKLFNNLNLTVHNLFLMALIIIAVGAVLSSRLYLKAHTIKDVFGGLLVGMLGQIIAIKIFI